MSSIVKPFKQFVFVIFALMLAGLCFSQSETKTPPASKKSNTQAASPTSKPKARGSADEEIPPAAPDAIFPAVVARVNGRAILGRDLERVVQTQLSPMGNPDWNKLREDYRGQLVYESINQLINSELIYQKATASGTTTHGRTRTPRMSTSISSATCVRPRSKACWYKRWPLPAVKSFWV